MGVKTKTTTVIGIEAFPIEVEAKVSGGLHRFSIVGLPDGILRESKERIKCAVESSGLEFPTGDVVVNLTPASLPKMGAGVELSIVLAILAADGLIRKKILKNRLFLGELSLDGMIKRVPGAFPSACYASSAKDIKEIVLAKSDARLASIIDGVRVVGVNSLAETVGYLRGEVPLPRVPYSNYLNKKYYDNKLTFSDVVGQYTAKRALEISAAGNHNVLMIGPPGSGKSMLASRMPSILPPLSLKESIEVIKIRSSKDSTCLKFNELNSIRPFRAPHHCISMAGLVGGGTPPSAGEISLSHCGVLFMDELGEFKRSVLESLRQPLESKKVYITRAKYSIKFPAKFLLIAAMNPCPCGVRGDGTKRCHCSDAMIRRYYNRLSQPFLDRIDINIWVPALKSSELVKGVKKDLTNEMRERVLVAREIQKERFNSSDFTNSDMSSNMILDFVKLTNDGRRLLEIAEKRYFFSNRAITRLLKLARTIADLEELKEVKSSHISEAISYRSHQFLV